MFVSGLQVDEFISVLHISIVSKLLTSGFQQNVCFVKLYSLLGGAQPVDGCFSSKFHRSLVARVDS